MKLADFIKAPEMTRDAADFIVAHFADQSAVDYFSAPRFEKFVETAKTGTWADAAKEYRNVTGEGIKQSVIAAEVARRIFGE